MRRIRMFNAFELRRCLKRLRLQHNVNLCLSPRLCQHPQELTAEGLPVCQAVPSLRGRLLPCLEALMSGQRNVCARAVNMAVNYYVRMWPRVEIHLRAPLSCAFFQALLVSFACSCMILGEFFTHVESVQALCK